MKLSKVPENSNLKVTVFWGDVLYDVIVCRPHEAVTIGRRPDNTFVFDTEKFTLVDVDEGNRADLHFSDKCDGHIRVGAEVLSLKAALQTKHVRKGEDGLFRVILEKPDKADVVLGHVTFYLDWVERANALPSVPVLQTRHKKLAALMLLVFLGAAGVLYFSPSSEPEKEPEQIILIEPSKSRAPPLPIEKTTEAPPSAAALGKKVAADGGAKKEEAGKVATTAAPPPKPVEKPSAVGSLRKANLGNLVSGLTNLGTETPNNLPSANVAKGQQEQAGTGGFTTDGLKKGAGGKSVGIGRTVGQGEGGFAGTGKVGIAGASVVEGTPEATGGGQPKFAGGLDHSVIQSVIRRREVRIRLCYDRQLNFNPSLSGKVAVHFTIGKTGSVINCSIVENTLKNAQVEQCIQQEVLTWTFPPPEGGTLVNVDYPFVFESSSKVH